MLLLNTLNLSKVVLSTKVINVLNDYPILEKVTVEIPIESNLWMWDNGDPILWDNNTKIKYEN